MVSYLDDDLLALLTPRHRAANLPFDQPEFGDEESLADLFDTNRGGGLDLSSEEMGPSITANMAGSGIAPMPSGRPKGFWNKMRDVAPDLINSGLLAVATPNTALGGPSDIARGIITGMQGAQGIRAQREAQRAQRARQQQETESLLALRKKQMEAAEAARIRASQQQRYVNVGGAVFDQQTGEYLDPKVGAFAREFEAKKQAWKQLADESGFMPGTAEYNSLRNEGKLPEGYGKRETPEKQPTMVEISAELATKHGLVVPVGVATIKVPEATYGRIVAAEQAERVAKLKPKPRTPGAMTAYQQTQLARSEEKDAKTEAGKKRAELAELNKAEYGDPTDEKKPGLHALREQMSRAMVDAGNNTAEFNTAVDRFNAATRALRNIYKQKRDLGGITEEQYQRYLANLQDAKRAADESGTGTSTQTRPAGRGEATTGKTFPRSRLAAYAARNGLSLSAAEAELKKHGWQVQ